MPPDYLRGQDPAFLHESISGFQTRHATTGAGIDGILITKLTFACLVNTIGVSSKGGINGKEQRNV